MRSVHIYKNIRKNSHMFARWGDGLAYHIGDLNHVLLEFEGYKKPSEEIREVG